jgi:large subunit ribosomal protein L6
MSRVGQRPIDIPDGVKVEIKDGHLTVEGPKGKLTRKFHDGIALELADGKIVVRRASDDKLHRSLHGLSRTLVANMVAGVVKGFEKSLEISGVGYRVQSDGKKLTLQLGYSHPVVFDIPRGIQVEVKEQTLKVGGLDKEIVGEFAATIRALRKVEPYRGKGIKYIGEQVRRKAGKTGVKATAS